MCNLITVSNATCITSLYFRKGLALHIRQSGIIWMQMAFSSQR